MPDFMPSGITHPASAPTRPRQCAHHSPRAVLPTVAALLVAAACGDKPTAATPATQRARTMHEQVMFGTVGILTSNGGSRGTIKADTALVFGGGERLELRNVTAILVDSAGADSSTLTARSGTYLVAGSKLTLYGTVRLQAPGGRRLQADSLRYDLAANAISSIGTYSLTGSSVRETNGVLVIDPLLRRAVKPKAAAAVTELQATPVARPAVQPAARPPVTPPAKPVAQPAPKPS